MTRVIVLQCHALSELSITRSGSFRTYIFVWTYFGYSFTSASFRCVVVILTDWDKRRNNSFLSQRRFLSNFSNEMYQLIRLKAWETCKAADILSHWVIRKKPIRSLVILFFYRQFCKSPKLWWLPRIVCFRWLFSIESPTISGIDRRWMFFECNSFIFIM